MIPVGCSIKRLLRARREINQPKKVQRDQCEPSLRLYSHVRLSINGRL